MKQIIKKAGRACAVTAFLLSSVFSFVLTSVLAEDNPEAASTEAKGNMKISCSYSSGIEPMEGDKFTISYVLTGLTEVQELEVDANNAAKGEIETEIPYGVYNVVDISYSGSNKEMETLGYGTDLIFQAVAEEEPDLLQVAVGSEAGRKLEEEGDGILAKVDGYIINSFEDLPIDGTDKSSSEAGDAEEPESDNDTSGEESQETKRDDEKQGETIYYDEDGDAKEENSSPIKKVIPLVIMAGIVAIVIFIIHKRGIL